MRYAWPGRGGRAGSRALWVRAGFGAVYGVVISPANLVAVPALGLTPPAWEFPLETSVRGVSYDIAYGIALESQAPLLRLHDDARWPKPAACAVPMVAHSQNQIVRR